MARPRRPELRYAEGALRRFINSQMAEFRRIGYPRMASFAKDIARGTVSLAPLPEDAEGESVGRFLWRYCNEVERRVASDFVIESRIRHQTAARLGMSVYQFNRKIEKVLIRLDGYLKGAAEVSKPAAAA